MAIVLSNKKHIIEVSEFKWSFPIIRIKWILLPFGSSAAAASQLAARKYIAMSLILMWIPGRIWRHRVVEYVARFIFFSKLSLLINGFESILIFVKTCMHVKKVSLTVREIKRFWNYQYIRSKLILILNIQVIFLNMTLKLAS